MDAAGLPNPQADVCSFVFTSPCYQAPCSSCLFVTLMELMLHLPVTLGCMRRLKHGMDISPGPRVKAFMSCCFLGCRCVSDVRWSHCFCAR